MQAPEHLPLPGTAAEPEASAPIIIHLRGQALEFTVVEALETIGVLAGILEGRARG